MNQFLRGTFQIKVDDKGRLSLPTVLRPSQEGTFNYVFTNSMYEGKPCLDLYPLSEWNALEQKISKLPQLKKEVQAFQRFYLASAQMVEVDSQGRLLIPKSLREFAKLEGEVVLVGMGSKIEVWSYSYWESVVNNLSEQFENNLKNIADLEGAA